MSRVGCIVEETRRVHGIVEAAIAEAKSCALCPGVVDWHNCDIVLVALECGWGLFVQLTFTL